MELNDLLNIPQNEDSITVVESFIALKKSNSRYDYLISSLFLKDIYLKYQKNDEAIKLLEDLFNDESIRRTKEYAIMVLDNLIKLYYDLKDYEQALEFVDTKKDFCLNKYYLYLYDYAKIYLKIDRIKEAKNNFIDIIDNGDDKYKSMALNDLIMIYIKENNLPLAFNRVNEYIDLANTIKNKEMSLNAKYLKVLLDYSFNELNIDNVNNLLECDDDSIKAQASIILLKYLLKKGEYIEASRQEVKYLRYIDKVDEEIKLDYYETCIAIYKNLGDEKMTKFYSDKLNKLKLAKQNKKLIRAELKKEKRKIKRDATSEELYQALDLNNKLLLEFKDLSFEKRIRDILLESGRILSKYANFKEMIIIIDENMYHYKKERLYDKSYRPIDNTVFEECYMIQDEVCYVQKEDLIGLVDIITNKPFNLLDIDSCVTMPLFRGKKMVGAISFYGDKKLLYGFNYEIIRFYCSFINTKLLEKRAFDEKGSSMEGAMFILEHMTNYVKYSLGADIYINNSFKDKIESTNVLTIDEYIYLMDKSDGLLYKDIYNNDDDGSITYKIKGLTYKETYRKFKNNLGEMIMFSQIEDISVKVFNEEQEYKKVYTSYVSKAKNRFSFMEEYESFPQRYSLVLYDIKGFKDLNDVYGNQYADNILYNISKQIKNYFNTEYYYHIASDEFIVVVPTNDIRTITKKTKSFMDYSKRDFKLYNPRLTIKFYASIIRIPTQTKENNPNKILKYLYQTLKTAKNKNEDIRVFDYSIYKEDLFEETIVKEVVDAIDHSLLECIYRPIVDIENKKIHQYYVNMGVINLDLKPEYVYSICKKRGLGVNLDRYLIKKSLGQAKALYEKYDRYIRIMIRVDNETLTNDFIDFLAEYLKHYDIPANLLTLEIDNPSFIRPLKKIGVNVSSTIIECLLSKCDYYLLDYINKDSFKYLIEAYEMIFKSMNSKLVIINSTNDQFKELIKYKASYALLEKQSTFDQIIKGANNDD